jgi:hypothetical protein
MSCLGQQAVTVVQELKPMQPRHPAFVPPPPSQPSCPSLPQQLAPSLPFDFLWSEWMSITPSPVQQLWVCHAQAQGGCNSGVSSFATKEPQFKAGKNANNGIASRGTRAFAANLLQQTVLLPSQPPLTPLLSPQWEVASAWRPWALPTTAPTISNTTARSTAVHHCCCRRCCGPPLQSFTPLLLSSLPLLSPGAPLTGSAPRQLPLRTPLLRLSQKSKTFLCGSWAWQ